MMLQHAHGQSTYQRLFSPHQDPGTNAGQEDEPWSGQHTLATVQTISSGSSIGRADPVPHLLEWLRSTDFLDDDYSSGSLRYTDFLDDYSSSSTTTPIDNEADVPFNGAPVVKAHRFDAECSLRHDSGPDAADQHFTRSRMVHGSATPSRVCCAPVPFTQCFSRDGQPRPSKDTSNLDHFLDEQTEQWDQRQQRSGAVGRLVVYHEGQSPKHDVFLRGGGCHHIVVANLTDGGYAMQAGVKIGDRLVSVDGKKDLLGLQAETVQDALEAPVALVFLGFVGKLEAEVRILETNKICGISSQQQVQGMDGAPLRLCDERVLNVGRAPLFLAVTAGRPSAGLMQPSDDRNGEEDRESQKEVDEGADKDFFLGQLLATPHAEEDGTLCDNSEGTDVDAIHSVGTTAAASTRACGKTPGQLSRSKRHVVGIVPCFELQRSEANSVVKRALQTIRGRPVADDASSLPNKSAETAPSIIEV